MPCGGSNNCNPICAAGSCTCPCAHPGGYGSFIPRIWAPLGSNNVCGSGLAGNNLNNPTSLSCSNGGGVPGTIPAGGYNPNAADFGGDPILCPVIFI